LDLIGKKENYVGYIAMRPRVEKQGAHGLFTQKDSEINLAEIAKTVAEHEGAVWTTVMSLRREDAEKLGYDNAKAWRDLLRGQSNKLAKAMGIPLADLRWYAAFHNEGSHPHIHLVSYSAGKEPYMTEQGLQSFKADFAREIFKQDNLHIYQEQTAYRDELRRTGREKMSAIVREINNGAYDNETVKIMLRNLVQELDNYTGRMVYGYMPKKAKNLIDGVVDELAKDERIAELYNLWYEQRENIVRTYQDSMPQRIPLSQNKEFRAIKNAVIQEALNLLHNNITFEDDVFEEEPITDTEPKTETKRNPWTDPEDMRYQYIRGKSYLDVESEDFDPDEAVRWLELSAEQGFDVAMYRLGKLYLQGYLIEKNVVQALHWLHKADDANNQYAQYLLGKLYLNGTEIKSDFTTAENMFTKAAMQGSHYAKYSLAKMHLKGQVTFKDIAFAIRLLTEAADQGNQWAEYQLGKMYLYGQDVDKNLELAVRYLSSSANKGNPYAQQLLDNYQNNTHGSSATVLASLRLLARLSQIIKEDADKRDKSGRAIDRKLMRIIEQKKAAQGQKMGG
ncbi:MAG: MobP3 family relaxase, partial [Clostridia bacterium]|nr:MobP3 family relaxase [Clostridia bacterium]